MSALWPCLFFPPYLPDICLSVQCAYSFLFISSNGAQFMSSPMNGPFVYICPRQDLLSWIREKETEVCYLTPWVLNVNPYKSHSHYFFMLFLMYFTPYEYSICSIGIHFTTSCLLLMLYIILFLIHIFKILPFSFHADI